MMSDSPRTAHAVFPEQDSPVKECPPSYRDLSDAVRQFDRIYRLPDKSPTPSPMVEELDEAVLQARAEEFRRRRRLGMRRIVQAILIFAVTFNIRPAFNWLISSSPPGCGFFS